MPSRNQLLCAIVSILSIATISFGGAIGTFYTAIYKTISPADLLVCQCVENKLTCGNFVKTDFVDSVFTKINLSKENIECAFKDENFYNFIYCDFEDLQTQVETHNNVVAAKDCINKDKQERLTIIGIVLFIISLILCVIALFLWCLQTYFITVPVDVQFNTPVDVQSILVALKDMTYTTVEALKNALATTTRTPNNTVIKQLEDMCPICIEDFYPTEEDFHSVSQLPECKHWFHTECIIKWIAINKICPLCRTVVSINNTDSNINESNV